MKRWLVMAFMVLVATFACESMADVYQGKFANSITDIYWSCLSPLTLGGMSIMTMGQEDTGNPDGPLCTCINPLRVGIKTGFWESTWRVGVTRTPYCFVSLGGIKLDPGIRVPEGEIRLQQDNTERSNYQVHWYADPVLYWLEVILDNPCLEAGFFDVAYITEVDPTWSDDKLTMPLNPETFLFGNPITQIACAGDYVLLSAGFGSNALFWCAGCQGSIYPFNGYVQAHVSHVQTSSLLAQRVTAKLHREFLMWGTSGADDSCDIYSEPMMDKTRYKYQMLYPIPRTKKISGRCRQPYSHTTAIWDTGRSYPYVGEDFAHMIFRKKNCCLGVGL